MKRSLSAMCFILGLFPSLGHAWGWLDWWYTNDQQAKKLMDQGQYDKAKDKFDRPDWSATAAYRAGDYEKAARQYADLNSQQGYYNQGNALAHLGKYEAAIDAYKKALALNPQDKDAEYNKKILEDLMKKDKQKEQDQQNKDQQNKDQQNKDQQNKDQQNKDQQNKDQQNKDQQNKDQQNKDQQNKDQQNKDQQNKDQQNKDQQNKDQQNKDQQNKDQQNKDQQNKDQQNKDQQNKDQQNQHQQNSADKGKKKSQQEVKQTQAEQEKQQAKDQWLRLIPDDPGGLMREKFLRDHLRRERGWYE